jgi:hypothetical protein
MYLVPPLESVISLNSNQNNRHLSQQRFTSSYSINLQTIPSANQSNGKILILITIIYSIYLNNFINYS